MRKVKQYILLASRRVLSKEEMIKAGADGFLDQGIRALIPLDKIVGHEPVPAASEGNPYIKGKKITQPIEVVYDKLEDNYILYGGNHRVAQATINGDSHILAFVQPDRGLIGKSAKTFGV